LPPPSFGFVTPAPGVDSLIATVEPPAHRLAKADKGQGDQEERGFNVLRDQKQAKPRPASLAIESHWLTQIESKCRDQ